MFRSGFFTSDSWTINGDGFAIGNKAEGSDFLAKIMHKILGDGAAEVTTTGFQVVKKTGLTCTVKPFFVCKNGYFAWNTADTDITFTSSASEQVFYVGLRLNLTSNEFTDDGAAAYATFVSAIDLASAKITIPANAVTLTDGMIKDLRYDTAYCGQIDEYRERSLALIAELEDALALLISGGVPAHASSHASGAADAITPSSIGAASTSHKTTHSTGGSDVLTPANIGAAELIGGVVKASQAKTLMDFLSGSFELQASHAEKTLFMYGSNIVITLPANLAVDNGTAFSFVRWGTYTVSFAAGSGAYVHSANNVVSISAQYASALAVKINDTEWWLSCG